MSEAVVRTLPRKVATHKTKVAVYCRVSRDTEQMADSLENQISHYEETVGNDSWYELVEIYHDYAISGFKAERPGFQRMMEDARAGKFQLIITKSITRFARNTDIVLSSIRELQSLQIGVYFELQNINTLTQAGELLMTLFAAFGEAESESSRTGTQMSRKRSLENGTSNHHLERVLGYDKLEDGTVVPNKDAETVMEIFEMAADGFTTTEISRWLNEERKTTSWGKQFYPGTVNRIIRNEEYKGDFIANKYYIDETRHKVKNNGEHTQYYFKEHHVPIVTEDLWNKAQAAIGKKKSKRKERRLKDSPYKHHLFCAACGSPLYLDYKGNRNVWYCMGAEGYGKTFCDGVVLPNKEITADADHNWYVGDVKDRGRHASFSFTLEDEWKKTHCRKKHRSNAPELTEENYPYMNRIFCKYCGDRMIRVIAKNGSIWWACRTLRKEGKAACKGIRIPDEKLKPLIEMTEPVYIGKEVRYGRECYGYSSKPD